MKLPKISCYCCTYARDGLLEEAIQSFLIQDYPGEKELVIVNDHPEQHFIFNHPQVRIINLKERIADIPAKHRFALSFCTGDIFKVWDDDDIHLPHALSSIAAGFKNGVYKTAFALIDSKPELELVTGPFHNAIAFSIMSYVRIGYFCENVPFDMRLIKGIHAMSKNDPFDIPRLGPWYIYRKFNPDNPYNISRMQFHKPGIDERVDAAVGELKRTGKIELNPHWSKPWGAIAAAALARKEPPKPIHEVDNSFVGLPKMNENEIQTSHVKTDNEQTSSKE